MAGAESEKTRHAPGRLSNQVQVGMNSATDQVLPGAKTPAREMSPEQNRQKTTLVDVPALASIPYSWGMSLVIIALVSGFSTYLILTGVTPINPTKMVVRSLFAVNLVVVVAMVGMIGWQIFQLWRARQRGIAGARLHVRLVSLFAIVATLPALLVAVFASVTLDRGLDSWFSERTRAIIDNAQNIAEAYLREHSLVIRGDVAAMANDLNMAHSLFVARSPDFTRIFTNQAALRALPGVFIIDDKGGDILHAVANNSGIKFIKPPKIDMEKADKGQVVIFHPSENSPLVRALIKLKKFDNAYLYVYRFVDPDVIRHLRETLVKKAEYDSLEGQRFGVQVTFGLMYVGTTLIFLLSAIWFGLGVANHLVTPIGRLIAAAKRVSAGDLDVQVPIGKKEGDIDSLGLAFNRMTAQLKKQHDELMRTSKAMDARRRFTEAVLAGVTPGVIGLGENGEIRLANTSASKLLEIENDKLIGKKLSEVVPEFAPLIKKAMDRRRTVAEHVDVEANNATRNYHMRITTEKQGKGKRGFVVTLDDITQLVAAQRTSAWADVARRIAHEIKNPLTPIQLSAERIKRKYGKVITTDREVFDKCTETIIRQVGDIRCMVDEFSSFARMPKAVLAFDDVREVVKEMAFLQKVGLPNIKFEVNLPEAPVRAAIDRRLIGQCITNIIKNAGEAIEPVLASRPGYKGRIEVTMVVENAMIRIDICDNGIGLPSENRNRLTEPYMTTRDKGTGLGLAIVSKIMEEHQGRVELMDAPGTASGGTGALVRLELPILSDKTEPK